ncbi:TPA: hypothetical protein TUM69_001208 [Streptococcus equi subsp. zooepidemicus]|uniref:Uncharacterized protein n=1 Tax=Streptococcus equi subsp. zooepidemicus TaxID=40041 RepID=A0A7Z8ZVC5_STRSZ|nr:hypothetical protein [Streptococcus equi]VEF05345.1 Uncharacterised protein [Streptococcus equi subsp. zooepidemicus]HEL0414587.1 hypothetical protein [Streptococcus equi subsp. zooepidemicus]HEL0428859.1 hypothetical protein [Streptococcus equi subsp. zooepidemicus]HEL0430947.1 hypothetical protein [Streptococcus equi subsp. zooepidemicus]HEL0435114.1 hypothetical protein [Streptococcus equi subsp. zooepidemicus]
MTQVCVYLWLSCDDGDNLESNSMTSRKLLVKEDIKKVIVACLSFFEVGYRLKEKGLGIGVSFWLLKSVI